MKKPSGGFIGTLLGLFLAPAAIPARTSHCPWSGDEKVMTLLIGAGVGAMIGTISEFIYRRRG
jgi:hypothetical protein